MATKKKLLQAAAGSAGGAGGLDIPDVFSTYLYSGNSSAQTITNGIDLDGEGGLWWLKRRTGAGSHALYDSTRATGSEHFPLFSNATNAEYDDFDTTPTSTGFTINSTSSGTVNETGQDYVSWTWRKAPKFFDVIQYVGDGVSGREISHSLNSEVGLILVKQTNTAAGWYVLHKDSGLLILNETVAQYSDAITDGYFGDGSTLIRPTSSVFTLGDNVNVNGSGNTYVAYLFAHNDGDGGFGPDGDADIIKCGSYTGNGSNTGPIIDLGFEPQWLMIKSADTAKEWRIHDTMRGLATNSSNPFIYANTTSQETNDTGPVNLLANGFQLSQGGSETNNNGTNYIYMAIRRGQLAAPEDATDVFDVETRINADPSYVSTTGVVDMAIDRYYNTTDDFRILSRLTGKNNLDLNNDTIETTNGYTYYPFDYNTGWFQSAGAAEANRISWMWKRAPGYFDSLCYTGTGANRTVQHNLNASPDMIWLKSRETVSSSNDWIVYCSAFSNPTDTNIVLNSSGGQNTGSGGILWNSTAPTDSVFSLGTYNGLNQSGKKYIAYLFSTLAGVSKVGSYAGSNSDQTIDCGFTAGARFVLIKNISRSSDWIVLDSVRGIVSGTDPFLRLNDNTSQNSAADYIDPDNSGFIVTGANSPTNQSGDNYIFYAIA